jgi:hypothetical protein
MKLQTWQIVMLFGGVLIIALAILDMMNVPLEFPTSSNGANLAIGVGIAATPFVYRKVLA